MRISSSSSSAAAAAGWHHSFARWRQYISSSHQSRRPATTLDTVQRQPVIDSTYQSIPQPWTPSTRRPSLSHQPPHRAGTAAVSCSGTNWIWSNY